METRLMGIETEYAVGGLTAEGAPAGHGAAVNALMQLIVEGNRAIRSIENGGVFLENGSQIYVDHGMHPEICTPECTNPWDVVRYVNAGDRIIERVLDRLPEVVEGLQEPFVTRSNVDYGGTGSTWGCHESYMHKTTDSDALPDNLLPHLVTRPIYTGSGGFDPMSPGIEFLISPRARFMMQDMSGASTQNRGIYHIKEESLAGGDHQRLHLLCGESLYSQIATALKVGTTALILLLCEQNLNPGEGLRIAFGTEALLTVARDPACRAPIRLASGGTTTALAIQRTLLDRVSAQLSQDFMPDWAGRICDLWASALAALEKTPEELDQALDWRVKRGVVLNHANRRGFGAETLARWNDALCAWLENMQQQRKSVIGCGAKEALLGRARRSLSGIPQLRAAITGHDLPVDRFGDFLDLRQELFELDTRFLAIGSKGLFAQLEAAGHLDHRLPEVSTADEVSDAVTEPPTGSRAQLRGKLVHRLSQLDESARYACTWGSVMDITNNRFLDLSNPFETEEKWTDQPAPMSRRTLAMARRQDLIARLLNMRL